MSSARGWSNLPVLREQVQQRTQRLRDLALREFHPLRVLTLKSEHLVAEAIRRGGFDGRPTPGQPSQRRLRPGGVGGGERGGVEHGVQSDPGEATATSHINAHVLSVQCGRSVRYSFSRILSQILLQGE